MKHAMAAATTNSSHGLHRKRAASSCNIRVAVRLRPLNEEEVLAGETSVWHAEKSRERAAQGPNAAFDEIVSGCGGEDSDAAAAAEEDADDPHTKPQRMRFDYVCPESESTTDLYYRFARSVIIGACDGCNGNVFAHGQTGSGKTFSTLGTESAPGIILLAFSDIFHYIRTHPARRFLLRVAYMEIYNDTVNCLLGQGRDLKPDSSSASTDGGVVVPGLRYEFVRSPKDFVALLLRGERSRKVGHTDLNRRSSRSHAILSVIIQSKVNLLVSDDADGGGVRCSALNLVDLAGSENIGQIGSKLRQTECRHINRSLLVLSRVIEKLSANKDNNSSNVSPRRQQHIPFRDCKLTRILQPALGGNSNCALIATLTPTKEAREESRNTLRFASIAARITNKVTVNEHFSPKVELRRARRLVASLRSQLERVKMQEAKIQMANQRLHKEMQALKHERDVLLKKQMLEPPPTSDEARAAQARIQALRQQLDEAEHSIAHLFNAMAGGGEKGEAGENEDEDGEDAEEEEEDEEEEVISLRDLTAAGHNTDAVVVCCEGMNVTKFCSGRKGSHESTLWLHGHPSAATTAETATNTTWSIRWTGTAAPSRPRTIALQQITRVDVGSLECSEVFRKNSACERFDLWRRRSLAMTLSTSERTLDVVMFETHHLEWWIAAIRILMPDLTIHDHRPLPVVHHQHHRHQLTMKKHHQLHIITTQGATEHQQTQEKDQIHIKPHQA